MAKRKIIKGQTKIYKPVHRLDSNNVDIKFSAHDAFLE